MYNACHTKHSEVGFYYCICTGCSGTYIFICSFHPEKLGVIGMPLSECDPATLRLVDKADDLDSELSKLIDRDEGDSGDSDSGGGDDEKDTGGAHTENS